MILLGTFDVIITECLCRFRCTTTNPHSEHIARAVSRSGPQPHRLLGCPLHPLADTVHKTGAPRPAEDFAITHHHFTLDAVLSTEADMSLNRHVDGFAVLQAADITGTYYRAFTGHIPPGFQTHKAPCQVICFTVRHLHRAGNAQLHRDRRFITGDGGIGIRSFDQHGFCKTPGRDIRQGGTFLRGSVIAERFTLYTVRHRHGLVCHLWRRRDAIPRIKSGWRRNGSLWREGHRRITRLRFSFRTGR
ncbi:Uncharacterised protein [Salmonella enterica subsp. enterica serovar Typhimurium str. DT104]|nr:Uncharacterised protein [Salmonella enterica subsp. enterica serovar Typhimurium str. DT104]CQF18884.1 Uncharacterised protein [Salmonella enterica subsp. enterica serovar Typhimurium str. DT104]CQM90876.1 Uncharacterised protein [Salmonella enterica subsp. enterica serovar Typhimurium str. DT104]CRF10770.1 Uncharacterised protein [Salmonella enterica subsp. enterica serovar Typhimurium str. DT104]